MPILGHRERIIIDWNDVLLVDRDNVLPEGGNNDISDYVQRIELNWGFGVTTSSTHFTPTMLRGRLRLNRDLDHIPLRQREGTHFMRYLIDDEVIAECYVQPVRNRTMRLSSPNAALLRERVDKSSVDARTDYWLWDAALDQVGAERGRWAYFNGYATHGGLRVRTTFANFIRQMMSFGGGYAFEDKHCRMNYMAAFAGRTRNYLELVSEITNDTLELTISPKPGIVRNAVKARIVRVNPFVRKLVRSFNVSLPGLGYRELFAAAPEGEIAGIWSLSVTKPNPQPETLQITKTNEDTDGVNFSLFNADDDPLDVSIDVFATSYDVSAAEEVNDENPTSILTYGFQPLTNFPTWGSSARPINEEIDRLASPLLICKLRMPIVPAILPTGAPTGSKNTVEWLGFDVGTLMLMSDGERDVVMMIGRKTISSRRAFILEWDLVEFPQGATAYQQGWLLDDPAFELGITTVVYDPAIRGSVDSLSANVSYNGRTVSRAGDQITRPPFNPLMHNHKFIKRDGAFISRKAI